jgi:hypothetical protein
MKPSQNSLCKVDISVRLVVESRISSENRGSNDLQGDLVAQSLDAAGGPPDRGLAVPLVKVKLV